MKKVISSVHHLSMDFLNTSFLSIPVFREFLFMFQFALSQGQLGFVFSISCLGGIDYFPCLTYAGRKLNDSQINADRNFRRL
jgi:hypothetical protein